ncbi:unnamed protein product [Prorocentrum cordatum]|uniref:CSC1/OSCA1-like 7TM region domain-containing protein n=1 Tax=Prorocentrum cordatum TaxID=2364126 RepID=A0ABN9R3B3_9DINO|nr:unnamed protein product [Polarella glacialis]
MVLAAYLFTLFIVIYMCCIELIAPYFETEAGQQLVREMRKVLLLLGLGYCLATLTIHTISVSGGYVTSALASHIIEKELQQGSPVMVAVLCRGDTTGGDTGLPPGLGSNLVPMAPCAPCGADGSRRAGPVGHAACVFECAAGEDHIEQYSGCRWVAAAAAGQLGLARSAKHSRLARPEPGAAREWSRPALPPPRLGTIEIGTETLGKSGRYLDAVCSTILRMQRNAGDFVRDSWRRPGVPEDWAPLGWRILDLPLLIVMVVATLLINPLSFLVLIVVPATVAIELHYGAAMRAAFCAPLGSDWIELFWLYSDFARVVGALPVSVAVTFVAFVLHKTCFSRRQYKRGAVSPFGYLLAKNSVAALSRLTVLVLLLIMILFLVPCLQIMSNGVDGCESRKRQCLRYINAEMSKTAAYRSSHPPKNLEQKEMFGTINVTAQQSLSRRPAA